MKRVFLCAYERRNLGDDLFIQTIVRRYPRVRFCMKTDISNRETFRDLDNLVIPEQNGRLHRILGRIHPGLSNRYGSRWEDHCHAMVYIGGSVFMEYPSSPQFVDWLKYQAGRHPFFVLGANFGPFRTEDYREGVEEAFRMMADICFRDQYSCDLFPGNDRVRYAPDMLLACPMPEVPVVPGQVFVSVIDTQGRDACNSNYPRNMARILQGYLNDGCSLVLASFCRGEGDEAGIQKVLSAMGVQQDPRIRMLCYDGTNREEILRTLAESDYVIASRFHAVILAMAAGRPVLPVAYSDKLTHVLEDLDFGGTVFDLRREGDWEYKRSRANWDNPPEPVPAQLREAAERHFEVLDGFLRK